MLPGAPLASLMRSRYRFAATRGIGPISATLVPPSDDPPAAPSVNSQARPSASAASDQGPATACACSSELVTGLPLTSTPVPKVKVSMRQ